MNATSSSRRFPSRIFTKLDIFLVFSHRRTLAIEQPAETSHPSFREEGDDQASSHPMYIAACEELP
jgi:hypothetical protein